MRKVFILLGLFFAFALSQMSYSDPVEQQPREVNDLVGEVLNTAINEIQRKHHMKVCGTGIAMPRGSVRQLSLAFQIRGELSQACIRQLLIECAHDLLQAVLNNEEIKPFLHYSDFDMRNVEVIFYISDALRKKNYDPTIGVASIAHKVLTYRTYDKEIKYKYKNSFDETYEEALQKLQADGGLNCDAELDQTR